MRGVRVTFENQLVFQKPGVPHGQGGREPESRQPGTVKSLMNQKSMAREMAFRRAELFTKSPAPSTPPCHAPAIVTTRRSS